MSKTVVTSTTKADDGATSDDKGFGNELVGGKLGKYEIRKKLGQGGMGAVFLAFDPMIEREVAIKVLPPDIAKKAVALERFLSEARATGKLNHVNVVAIYDISQEGDLYYIVMELVRGGSVADFIEKRKAIHWQQACEITAAAADGLAAAHEAGLVHRDIKPENLMQTVDGTVKVVDFGLSKLTDAAKETELGLTTAGQLIGTPYYMSPEQIQGETIDARSDIYSLGGTLYSLLTNAPPYIESNTLIAVMAAHMQAAPPDPKELNAEVPDACCRIVEKAMAKDPEDRFSDAGEMAQALRDLLDPTGSKAPDQPQSYEPLKTAVILELSRMQSMVLQRALQNAGASKVTAAGTSVETIESCGASTPDLLITAQELPDGKGNELIAAVHSAIPSDRTVYVLHSSDSSLSSVASTGQSATVAVASKKKKPDELLHAIHACTFLSINGLSNDDSTDMAALRFGFVSDVSRIPDPIAHLIRDSNLLDTQIETFDGLAAGNTFAGKMDVVIVLRIAGDSPDDALVYADLLSRAHANASVVVAVQVDGDEIHMRAVRCGDFSVLCRGPLNSVRLQRLCRLSQQP